MLAVIFILWYRTEGTLSIHSIRTPRRELFYWATVLATFALGTATGDMTAKTLNLGYLASGIWFLVAFAAVAVAHWKFGLNPILAFWIAYVLTRPVGASFADYIAFPQSVGGLGVGHGPVALVLTVVIVILVAYLAVTRKDVENPRQAAASAAAARHRGGGPQQPGYPPASRPMPPHAARPGPAPVLPRPVPGSGSTRRSGTQGSRTRAAPRPAMPPRSAPQRSGPPPRSAPPRQPREPWPPQERRPSRQSPQPPEPWPDEDEAEQTAWGFFMWDE